MVTRQIVVVARARHKEHGYVFFVLLEVFTKEFLFLYGDGGNTIFTQEEIKANEII